MCFATSFQSRLSQILSIACLILLTGCSNRALYDNIQSNAKLECEKGPPQEYDNCIKAHSQTYDAYKNSRKPLIEH